MRSFSELVNATTPEPTSAAAWSTFESTLRRWIEETQPRVVLEIGGGRSPMLSPDECRRFGIDRYLVNDVSQSELDRLPADRERACFDVQNGPPLDADYAGQCDLVFAHMVFEHVADPAGAWRTVNRLLCPGGTAVSFNPVLFSPPFLANRLLPERLTRRVLRIVFSRRNDDDHPKFPAYYRWCRASARYMSGRLRPIGFTSVDVRPFWGHYYFRSIPLIRTLDNAVNAIAQRKAWSGLASYAYVIAIK